MIPFRARFSVLFHNTADSQRLHFNVITDYRFLAHSQFTGFLISQNTDSHFVSFVSFRKLHEAFYTKQGNKICTFVSVHSSKEKFRSFVCDRQKIYIYIYFFFFFFFFLATIFLGLRKSRCSSYRLSKRQMQNHGARKF